MGDTTTAECVKVFEGVYRDVNIALANELATMADELGVDVRRAIEAANTQPFCDIHDPGPGVGGHCIPYYPYFLTRRFETATPLLETAREVNESMPAYTVDRLADALADAGQDLAAADVAVLGLAYRPGVDETRASPAYPIARRLDRLGATVYATDPVVTDVGDIPATTVAMTELPAVDPDAVVIVTPHAAFEDVPWDDLAPAVIFDGRDGTDLTAVDAPVYTIGRTGPESATGTPAGGESGGADS
jgi:UDP-N-acetyl-D-mannosaminuronic acid dehydrogenase